MRKVIKRKPIIVRENPYYNHNQAVNSLNLTPILDERIGRGYVYHLDQYEVIGFQRSSFGDCRMEAEVIIRDAQFESLEREGKISIFYLPVERRDGRLCVILRN